MGQGGILSEEAILRLMYLAALSDGELCDIELNSIKTKLVTYPLLRNISTNQRNKILSDLLGTLQDRTTKDILKELKEKIPDKLKETAYAFALEVCAKDLVLHKDEISFLKYLAKLFNIDNETADALRKSINVRYFAPLD